MIENQTIAQYMQVQGPQPCPTCGICPTCGRKEVKPPSYVYPYTYPNNPHWTYTNQDTNKVKLQGTSVTEGL